MAKIKLAVPPVDLGASLKDRVYEALRDTISETDIYAGDEEPRLDERELSLEMGVSRTPIREAIVRLEQEGLVRIVPRRGVFVARKSKAEIVEMITIWAGLESVAARMIIQNATDEEIAELRDLFATFKGGNVRADIDEYSETNICFHQAILRLSKSPLLNSIIDPLFIHMRAIRARTIGEDNRADRSIIDHMNIIEALERRDTVLAEKLVREHTLGLAAHVARHVDYLD